MQCNSVLHPSSISIIAPYSIGQSAIPSVKLQKDLRVVLSDSLSWNDHYDLICSIAYQALYVIRRSIPPHSPAHLKKLLYRSLVKSQVSYCCQLWRSQLIKHIKSLERIQRKATKFILSYYSNDYKSRLLELSTLPLMYWLEIQDIMLLIKTHLMQMTYTSTLSLLTTGQEQMVSNLSTISRGWQLRETSFSSVSFGSGMRSQRGVLDLESSVSTNKTHLTEYLWEHFSDNLDPNNLCTFHFLCPCYKCIINTHVQLPKLFLKWFRLSVTLEHHFNIITLCNV